MAGPLMLLVSGLVVACGSLSENTDKPSVLARIRGQVTAADPAGFSSSPLRVAVVWVGQGTANDEDHYPTQEVALTTQFPTNFELRLAEPPPSEAMALVGGPEAPDGTLMARGYVVVYEDKNQNARLDKLAWDAKEAIDEIVGAGTEFEVVYIEQRVPRSLRGWNSPTDESMPSPGFNLFYDNSCSFGDGVVGACRTPVSQPIEKTWKRIDTPITISLSKDPVLNGFMCPGIPAEGPPKEPPIVNEHPVGEMPSEFPSDRNFFCGAGNAVGGFISYTHYSCTTVRVMPCDASTWISHCVDDQYSLPEGGTPPSGWPCKSTSLEPPAGRP
jgi:hypothetical protein